MLMKLNNGRFLLLQERKRPKLILICQSDRVFYNEGIAPKEYYIVQNIKVDNFNTYENHIEKVILFRGQYFSGKNFRNVFEIKNTGVHILVAEFWIHHDGYSLTSLYSDVHPIWVDHGGTRNRGAMWYIFNESDISQIK